MSAAVQDATALHLARIDLALSGSRAHAEELPSEALEAAEALEGHREIVQALLQEQATAHQLLDALHTRIQGALREAGLARGRLVRLVEHAFGPGDPRLRHFRPAIEARLHVRRTTTPAQ